MFEQKKGSHSSKSGNLPNNKKTGARKGTSLIYRLQAVNVMQFISAIIQFFMGLTVIALSLMGLIQPVYVALMLCVVGSLSSVIGLYMLYSLLSADSSFETLINEAIKRAINFQN